MNANEKQRFLAAFICVPWRPFRCVLRDFAVRFALRLCGLAWGCFHLASSRLSREAQDIAPILPVFRKSAPVFAFPFADRSPRQVSRAEYPDAALCLDPADPGWSPPAVCGESCALSA
jgi:hypothetical protein